MQLLTHYSNNQFELLWSFLVICPQAFHHYLLKMIHKNKTKHGDSRLHANFFFSLPVLEVVEAYGVPVFAPSACELECKPSSLCLYRCSLTSSELCLASIAIR